MSEICQARFKLFQIVMLDLAGSFLIRRIDINAFGQGRPTELLTRQGQSSMQIALIRTGQFPERWKQY
jgi:hypothetical protein